MKSKSELTENRLLKRVKIGDKTKPSFTTFHDKGENQADRIEPTRVGDSS